MSCSIMVWKEEPESPLSCNEVSLDATLYQTPLEEFGAKLEADLALTKYEEAEAASQEDQNDDLDDLEEIISLDLEEFIKNEPFLLDGHILDEVEAPRAVPVASHDLKKEFKQIDTQYYLNEFRTVYEEVGLTHNALTPPQSPPNNQPLLANLEPLLVQLPYSHQETKLQYDVPEKQLLQQNPCGPLPIAMEMVQFSAYPESVVPTFQPDIDQTFSQGLAVDELEELVRTTAEDMQWNSSSSNHSSSPGSPGGSSSSNFGDCSSDDPEWIPETIEDNREDGGGKVARKRRGYTKGAPEDKKVRKKEQNKNAATRYRMKKKAEIEVILTEERQLAKHHDELETKIVDLQREIKYLKGLMRDLFKAKGLIN